MSVLVMSLQNAHFFDHQIISGCLLFGKLYGMKVCFGYSPSDQDIIIPIDFVITNR